MGGLVIHPIGDNPAEALRAALPNSSYLRGLDRRYSFLEGELSGRPAQEVVSSVQANLQAVGEDGNIDAAKKAIRIEKARGHFALAGLDLSGTYSVGELTEGITALADASVAAALRTAAAAANLSTEGLVVFALGKMGAGELNYSSDIDMAVFFDPDIFDSGEKDKGEVASRLVRTAMAILDERTADGYGFRTDLRLRPDPSSNPLAVPTNRAEIYYESVGQNWERMVWIKGRPVAGDLDLGEHFLKMIEPFVWRRHLDYWAIADVRAVKSMINARMKALSADIRNPDVKLGPGGIREVEFFVQTQQVILGGRNRSLRSRKTVDGLAALAELGAISDQTAAEMTEAYNTLRCVEHRVQMRLDEQTHRLPEATPERLEVARLCGHSDLDVFDQALFETRTAVNQCYLGLFAEDNGQAPDGEAGNLVFTGVDDDPGTVEHLTDIGFKEPSYLLEAVRYWHRGNVAATRSERARALLTALLPDLISRMAKTGEPDRAFRRFRRFLESLSSGVQVFSMLQAEPALLDDLIITLALAPRIGETLARDPSLLESLLSVTDREEEFSLSGDEDFETAMNKARIWHSEHAFLIGHKLLHGGLSARHAAQMWSGLADDMVTQMASAAERETIRQFGAPPGVWSVVALGKFGGSEMTASSDLDLLVIYDAQGRDDAQSWFTRFTQRLITALSAATAKGSLYEVDMRLRPSGRAGPVATSISSFERYHRNEAWTWEHMALTRIRCIAGNMGLGARATDIAWQVISAAWDAESRAADILDMRRRLLRDKAPGGNWDLKMREGGLVDIEFIVQKCLLVSGVNTPSGPRLVDQIEVLRRGNILTDAEAGELLEGLMFLQSLQQVQRLTINGSDADNALSLGLQDRLCRAVGCETFEALEHRLEQVAAGIKALRCKKLGPLTTDTGASPV